MKENHEVPEPFSVNTSNIAEDLPMVKANSDAMTINKRRTRGQIHSKYSHKFRNPFNRIESFDFDDTLKKPESRLSQIEGLGVGQHDHNSMSFVSRNNSVESNTVCMLGQELEMAFKYNRSSDNIFRSTFAVLLYII